MAGRSKFKQVVYKITTGFYRFNTSTYLHSTGGKMEEVNLGQMYDCYNFVAVCSVLLRCLLLRADW